MPSQTSNHKGLAMLNNSKRLVGIAMVLAAGAAAAVGQVRIGQAAHPPIAEIPPRPMPFPEAGASFEGGVGDSFTIIDGQTGDFSNTVVPGIDIGAFTAFAEADCEGLDIISEGGSDENVTHGMVAVGRASRESHPGSAMVKMVMEYTRANGVKDYYVGSGTMIDFQVVVTAAHNVYDHSGTYPGGAASKVWVYPGWDGNGVQFGPPADEQVGPFGYGSGTLFLVPDAYINGQSFDSDFALVRLNDRPVGALTGWLGIGRLSENCPNYTMYNWSFPAETCNAAGTLHTGRTMYYMEATPDSCPSNLLRINTNRNCTLPVWKGMSGSSLYAFSGDQRYVEGTLSHRPGQNNFTSSNFARMTAAFGNAARDFWNDTRGTNADIHALRFRLDATRLVCGQPLPTARMFLVNPTRADYGPANTNYTVYLSRDDDQIQTSDRLVGTGTFNNWGLLRTQSVTRTLAAMTVPNVAAGTYYIGARLANGIDASNANNDTSGWDAQLVTVARCVADMSTTSDPTSPLYGIPDGTVDAADFFFYLDAFTAGVMPIADLTTVSDPSRPSYGRPNGIIDAADFFYYLDQFVAGCP